MYISCFSSNFVPLKKFFPVNSKNGLNITRNGKNLIEPEALSVEGRCFRLVVCDIEISLHWRVMARNPSLEGPVQNKGSHIHQPFGIQGLVCSCVTLGITGKALRKAKGRNLSFSSTAPVSCPAGWCRSSTEGALAITDILCVTPLLGEGGGLHWEHWEEELTFQ